jgi:hypothetical protein
MVNGMNAKDDPIVMKEVTDPSELAAARAQHEQFDRNAAWLQLHASEVYPNFRGKFICIAGEELFVADTAIGAVAKASAAHPEDKGRFVHYIPKEKIPRIYAH